MIISMHPRQHAILIQQWAALYTSSHMEAEYHRSQSLTWDPVEVLLNAALEDANRQDLQLRELLKLSNDKFTPFADPLLTDLGLHRWLSADREEAYSDWLQWVLQQLDPEMISLLFGIDEVNLVDYCKGKSVKVRREVMIECGRLDLLVEIGDKALIMLEVKRMASADSADTDKHEGYCKWFSSQHYTYKPTPRLLVVNASLELYKGFVPVLWKNLCIRLRRWFPQIRLRVGTTKAAMVLAFIGAVESNLLQLSTPYESEPRRLLFGRTSDHLQEALGIRRESG
jgi:hypothetical protein